MSDLYRLQAIAVGVVGAAFLLSADRHPAPAQAAGGARVKCVAAIAAGPFAPERSLAAVRRALRPQTLTNQSGRIHLTPRNYTVDEVAWLGPGVGRPTLQKRYFDRVRTRCGISQAQETWLVSITLSQATLSLPPLVLLASPTKQGWRVVLQSYRTG